MLDSDGNEIPDTPLETPPVTETGVTVDPDTDEEIDAQWLRENFDSLTKEQKAQALQLAENGAKFDRLIALLEKWDAAQTSTTLTQPSTQSQEPPSLPTPKTKPVPRRGTL